VNAYGIVVAGGTGRRMGTTIPKQLLKLGEFTILERSLIPFVRSPEIKGIIVVAAETIIEHIMAVISGMESRECDISVVPGGDERQHSVWNGLEALPVNAEIAVIHDAVRPFITAELVGKCVDAARTYGAVTVMKPVSETVKEVSECRVIRTLDRSKLWITQTPQAFTIPLILEAHNRARQEQYYGTDDCVLVERLGHTVHVIEGDEFNIKITTPEDLEIARVLLKIFEHREDE